MGNLDIEYGNSGAGLVTTPSLLVNYRNRIINNFEQIPTMVTNNDNMISVSKKSYYIKEIGDLTLGYIDVQHSGLNNLWVNKVNGNNGSLVSL